MRFVQTNLYEDAAIAEIGRHDVVWCSGLLYHTPNPVLALRQLLRLTGETLIVGSKVVPAVPGLPGMAVYYPGLSARDRTTYAPVAPPVAKEPYDPERYFANWYWGLTPDSIVAIARSLAEVRVVEEIHLPWQRRHDSYYVVLDVQPT